MNKGRIVQVTVGMIVLIGLLLASLFVIEISKSNQKEFLKGLTTLEEPFLRLTGTTDVERKARSQDYIVQGKMQVKLDGYRGQELEEKIEQGTNIIVTGQTKGLEKQSFREYTWKKEDMEVMKVKLLRDGQKIAWGADEIVNAYVAVENTNLHELLGNLDKPAPYAIDKIEENSLLDFFLLEEIEKEALQEYGTVLAENTKKEDYKKVKQVFSIDGKQRQVTGYGLTLDPNKVKILALAMCQTLQEDSITLNLLSKRMKTLGFPEEETNINAIHERLEGIKQSLQNGTKQVQGLTIVYYPWKKQCLQLEVIYGGNQFVFQQEPKTDQVALSWKTKENMGKVAKAGNQTMLQISNQKETWEIVQEAEEKETGLNRKLSVLAKDANGTFQMKYQEEKIFQEQVDRIERLTNENSVTLNQYPKSELRILLQAIQTQWDFVCRMKREQLLQFI